MRVPSKTVRQCPKASSKTKNGLGPDVVVVVVVAVVVAVAAVVATVVRVIVVVGGGVVGVVVVPWSYMVVCVLLFMSTIHE